MVKEDFIPLLEIQSVEKKLQDLKQIIERENARFVPLERLKIKNEQKLQDSTSALDINLKNQKNKEIETAQLSRSLEITNQELMNIKTEKALKKTETEIERIKKAIEATETKSLELLEEEELLNIKLEEVQIFNQNFPQTYKEIKEDIEKDNETTFKQIRSLEEHLNQLKNSMPLKVKEIYEYLKEKMPNPVTFLENNKCGSCATLQDQLSIKSIETYTEIVQCSTCRRILISKELQY